MRVRVLFQIYTDDTQWAEIQAQMFVHKWSNTRAGEWALGKTTPWWRINRTAQGIRVQVLAEMSNRDWTAYQLYQSK